MWVGEHCGAHSGGKLGGPQMRLTGPALSGVSGAGQRACVGKRVHLSPGIISPTHPTSLTNHSPYFPSA